MFRFALGLLAVAAATSPASAAFQLQYDGRYQYKNNLDISYSYKGVNGVWYSGSFNNLDVGDLKMKAVGQGPNGSTLTFKTFCIDLFHSMTSSYMVDITPLSTQPGANGSPAVAPMGGWLGGGMAYLYNKYLGLSNPNSNTAAAYQVAIWRLTLGANATIDTDSNTIDNLANTLYAEALLNLGTQGLWLSKTNGTAGQSVLYPGQPTPVPAPGAIVMLASGGLFAGAFGRIRRRFKTA